MGGVEGGGRKNPKFLNGTFHLRLTIEIDI